jgi:hypothetical protein
MSYDPFQALYSGTGGVLLLLLTTIESTYPTVCVTYNVHAVFKYIYIYTWYSTYTHTCIYVRICVNIHSIYTHTYISSRPSVDPHFGSLSLHLMTGLDVPTDAFVRQRLL